MPIKRVNQVSEGLEWGTNQLWTVSEALGRLGDDMSDRLSDSDRWRCPVQITRKSGSHT